MKELRCLIAEIEIITANIWLNSSAVVLLCGYMLMCALNKIELIIEEGKYSKLLVFYLYESNVSKITYWYP